jgi:spore coat polysaccharide biosynthesis predicted glycosyltransferase SpsG/CMP-N-acetylneuraminic acid synthetase
MSGPDTMDGVWVLVPARGGSKGIRGKNLRSLAGRPLVAHVLDELSRLVPRERLVVSTDDSLIAHAVEGRATVHDRPADLSDDRTTLDEVTVAVARWALERGAGENDVLITVQPTSPFLRAASVREAAVRIAAGDGCVVSVRDDRGLRWTVDERGSPAALFTERVNRQWLPPTLIETGGMIGARMRDIVDHGTRIIEPVSLVELGSIEGLDIDTYADWAVAEFYASRRRIAIRADAGPDLGMGHVYRAYALFLELHDHDVRVVVSGDEVHRLGVDFLRGHDVAIEMVEGEKGFLDFLEWFEPDIVIMDMLDTDEEHTAAIRPLAPFLVAVEDLGPGAQQADLVINDLYTDFDAAENHWYGVNYAILGPQFESVGARPEMRPEVANILVSFGGADPRGLTAKALEAIAETDFAGVVTVVLGPGYQHGDVDLDGLGLRGTVLRSVTDLAVVMRDCDIALTSAGRTVTELMTQGIPTISMCQNTRELMHTHASSPFGVTNLGLGEHVTPALLAQHISLLLEDAQLRAAMRSRMLTAIRGRSNRRIVTDILSAAESSRKGKE